MSNELNQFKTNMSRGWTTENPNQIARFLCHCQSEWLFDQTSVRKTIGWRIFTHSDDFIQSWHTRATSSYRKYLLGHCSAMSNEIISRRAQKRNCTVDHPGRFCWILTWWVLLITVWINAVKIYSKIHHSGQKEHLFDVCQITVFSCDSDYSSWFWAVYFD